MLVVVDQVATAEQALEMREGDQVESDAGVGTALLTLAGGIVTVVLDTLVWTSVAYATVVVKLVEVEVTTDDAGVLVTTTIEIGGW